MQVVSIAGTHDHTSRRILLGRTVHLPTTLLQGGRWVLLFLPRRGGVLRAWCHIRCVADQARLLSLREHID